jgi:adenylate kinase
MQIALMGPPGSGKTTVGRSISEKFNVPYISSGEIARQLAEADPTTALSLKSGSMAPEESMRALVKKQLERATAKSGGFVIEGFPRTVAQYIALRMWGAMPFFIWLELGEYGCLERLLDRARDDDTPDAIARRLQTYQEETIHIRPFLTESGQIHAIHAGTAPDDVVVRAEMAIARHLP